MAQTPTLTLVFEVSAPERPPRRVTLSNAKSIVGRESGDIVLGDSEASALHAEIDTSAGHVIVRDLGSSNGTWRDGERLPQFALYEGQSFYCGNTQLELVSIEGAEATIRPGQTAIGRTRVKASGPAPSHEDTLVGAPSQRPIAPPPGWTPPSPVSLGTPAPVAESTQVTSPPAESRPTVPAPSSSPTVPGDANHGADDHAESSETIPAHAESRPTVPRSSATMPGPAGASSATPASRTLPKISTQIPIQPDAGHRESEPEPPPTVAEPSGGAGVFRPPVANAVIKSDSDAVGDATPSAAVPRRSRRRWGRSFAIAGLSALGVGALAGVGYLLYALLAARSLAFGDQVAEEVPSSAFGFVALRSIDDALALVADEGADDPLKLLRVDVVGFDPFDTEAWTTRGIDTAQPVGLALLDRKAPVFAVSFGISDRAKFEAALQEQLPRLLGSRPEQSQWSDRDYGERDGLWYDGGAAVVHRDDRSTVVFAPRPGRTEDVEEQANVLGTLRPEKSLAQTAAYRSLVDPQGDPLLLGYADGNALRDALPTGGSALAARLAMADLDGVGVLLSHERDAIVVTSEVVVREGSRHLDVLERVERDGKVLRHLKSPVLLAYDGQLDGPAVDRALGGIVTALGGSLPVVERDISDALGVELRADITQNISGAFGAAVLALPPDRDHGRELEAAAWVGVLDEDAASETLGRIYDEGFQKIDGSDVAVRQVDDTAVYTMPEDPERDRPKLQLFVHAGHVWLLVGPRDASMVIDGPSTPFLEDARHPTLSAVMGEGGNGAGFVDVRAFLTALRPSLRIPDQEGLDALGPVLDLLETVTVRLDHQGPVVMLQSTLHTSDAVGLRGLLEAVTKHLGASVDTELAQGTRASRCAVLSKHVVKLSLEELDAAGASQDAVWEIERSAQALCRSPQMTAARLDCYLEAESSKDLTTCDERHPVGPTPPDDANEGDVTQAEPKLVPYVDDIWPHRVDDPESDTPQPDVNYAVPVGEDTDMRGRTDALVTIVMFGDFECPHCRAVIGTVDDVLDDYGEDVRLIFRHLPLENIHDQARPAAKAALAASAQGKFWAMHDALYARGNRLDEDLIAAAAREAGLDMDRFATDLASAEVDRRLQRDVDTAEKFGIKGTPAFFINGRYLGGRQSASAFSALIEEERARARKFVERRGDTRKRLYEDMLGHFAPEVLEPETAIAIPPLDGKRYTIDTSGLPQKGAESFAQVEIVECGDFDCPFCARSRKALEETLDSFSGVTLYYAHNPLEYHPGAEPAARAATAAQAQGKFWEMHDELFKDQRGKPRSDQDYKRYAARLGLDMEAFEADYGSQATADAVAKQQKLCVDNDATVTPTFFVNGRRVTGAQTAEQLEAIVRSELSEGI